MDQKTFKFNSEIYLSKENLQSIHTFEINFKQLENFFSETNKFILLYGDERSGKKYILNSFINCFHFDKKIFYASLEDDYFSEKILEGISYFDVIVLDRLDLAPTDSNWELGIFNLYNELNEADKSKIIFLSDKPLNSIEFNLKDLQSRISSISAMSFAELNDEEKRILMKLIFNKRGISIDKSVLSKQNGLMLEDLKEKNTVINFWADWCPPCIKEIPELNALYEENKDELNVYLFHFDELAGAELDEQLIRFNARIPSLLTSPYQIFGIDIPETLPVTVIIDRDLNVKEVLKGPQTKESIIQRLELIN